MAKTFEEVSRDAASLTELEQLKLARVLLSSSCEADVSAVALEQEWEKEIQGRLEDMRNGKVKAIPLDKFKRRMEANRRS